MNQDTTYTDTYPRLFALAYRMTGSVSDAEDVIQEAWTRLLNQPSGKVDSRPKWLYRTVSNLAIDTLRTSKRTATGYHGPWLPEPYLTDTQTPGPESQAIAREDISMALLLMLENLSPVQRAVWVLRTSLELSFAEISEMVDRTEENCRQLFRRAGSRLKGEQGRELQPAPTVLVERFLAAMQSGDTALVTSLLMDDATWIGDGGGVKPATARPVVGADKVGRGLTSLAIKSRELWRLERVELNGQAGLLVHANNELDAAWLFLGNNEQISHVLSVRNPNKFRGIFGPDFRNPSG